MTQAALTSQRKSDDRQYWKFSYQRSLPNKGGGKGKGGGGKNKGGGGIKDGGKGKGGAVIKPKPTPTPKPQVDPATQQLIDANNQLLQQVAANNAWQQQMISALVGRVRNLLLSTAITVALTKTLIRSS
ncbi:hypothetical protein OE88DRAFT_374750 [Heliocybe sulcata]|uniref:Uncharacterized protein n=1 Tax=Heliocybe sulcata TaxID=5364 RepID=A0A5C3MXW6_9AGAM|nr:hypothetical protein OE88DRAFT_374750 [Heliocybe sulcata]